MAVIKILNIDEHQKAFSNDDLLNIIEGLPVGMAVSYGDGSFAYANPALMRMLGYSKAEIYDPSIIITHPDELSKNQAAREQLAQNPDQAVMIEKRYIHKDGHSVLGLATFIAIADDQGNVKYFVSQIINIESHKKIEKSAHLFRSMINSSRETMFIIDPATGKILDSNIKGCESLGYSYDELLTLSIFDIDLNIAEHYDWDRIIAIIRNTGNSLIEGIHRRKNNNTFPVEMSISYLELEKAEYILALVRDISERRKSEELIWRQANYDALTNLPNRNMLYNRLDKIIKQAQYKDTQFAVLCLDLDKFKNVNDALGHYVGDKLLSETGKRIKQVIRNGDTIARLGGDEFCLLVNTLPI